MLLEIDASAGGPRRGDVTHQISKNQILTTPEQFKNLNKLYPALPTDSLNSYLFSPYWVELYR